MPKRIDPEDTVDVAIHLLQRWQAEGFGVQSCNCDVEYGRVSRRRFPISVEVTVRLVPGRA
jgi:hypothetical protein